MPTFSEVQITITADFVLTEQMQIVTSLTSMPFTWVTTRSGAGEVTTGTPTATPGERTAINLEAAFDLDFPAGYITTQATNVLTIQSETLDEDFLGIIWESTGTGQISVVYTNFVAPFDLTTVDLALTRSPYIVNTPFDFSTTTKMTLDLRIWDGDITTDKPVNPTVTLTKIRPTIDFAEFNTDISKIVRERLDEIPNPITVSVSQVVDSGVENIKWVEYIASYTDPDVTIADITGILLAVDGYGRYDEGVNPPAPANQILSSVSERKVDRTGLVMFPFINDSTITSIDVDTNNAEVNTNHVITSSNESTDYIQYIVVDVEQILTDTVLTITTNPAGNVYTYYIQDECRYVPMQIVFKNRYGVFDTMTMFKKSTTSIETTREEFVNNYIVNGEYASNDVHQFKDLNVESSESITLNSGYVGEAENDLYRELLESDKVYFWDGAKTIPVQVKTNSLDFKTRVNDRLTFYQIEFKYAYHTIQNV